MPSRFAPHLLTLAALLIAVSGCSNPDVARLAGVWQLDPDAGLELRLGAERVAENSPDPIQLSTGSNRMDAPGEEPPGINSAMTLSFHPGGRLETKTRAGAIDSLKTGTWQLVSYDSQQQSAVITCTLGQQTTEQTVQWIDADTIKLTPPNMAGLSIKWVFRRQQGPTSR
jgi:hypothetical protein